MDNICLKSSFNRYDIELTAFRRKDLILTLNTVCAYVLTICWVFVAFDFIGIDDRVVFTFFDFDFGIYDIVKTAISACSLIVIWSVKLYWKSRDERLKLARISIVAGLIARGECVFSVANNIAGNYNPNGKVKDNVECFRFLDLNTEDILLFYSKILKVFNEAKRKALSLIIVDIFAIFLSYLIIKDKTFQTMIAIVLAYVGIVKYQYDIFREYKVSVGIVTKFKMELINLFGKNGEIDRISFSLMLESLCSQKEYHCSLIRQSMEYYLFRCDSFLILNKDRPFYENIYV